jgi:predicted DNA-binding transcriptional regulator YafY
MYDPIMRVFAVLEILQARDSVTGAYLAERLEVDLRTVQRYIVRLKDLGIPISSSPGVGGAYRLRAGYRVPPLLLTNEEAFALSLGLKSLRSIGLSAFAPATESAIDKLERVIPESLRESMHAVEEVVAIEPGQWAVPTSIQSLIAATTAIRTARRVRFSYQTHGKLNSLREVEPYAVMHADDRWYLIGHCTTRQALRTFRLDRASDLDVTSTAFLPPNDFNAREYFAGQMPFLSSRYQIDVWLDLPSAVAANHFAMWRVSMQSEGTGTRVRCGRDQLDLFAAVLLSVGCRIVVHSPEELRETFQQLSRRAAEAATSQFS